MKKIIQLISLLLILGLISSCSIPSNNENNTNTQATSQVIVQSNPAETTKPYIVATDEPVSQQGSLGGQKNRIKSISLSSFDDISKLSADDKAELDSYGFEKCYFSMKKIPDGMIIDYMALLEVGFTTWYKNPDTEDTIMFYWWANQEPTDYIKVLEENITRLGTTLIKGTGNTYYCDFVTITNEPTDKTHIDQPYHAEIRWVEDNKCFYINISSNTPLNDTVIDYCLIEKHTID